MHSQGVKRCFPKVKLRDTKDNPKPSYLLFDTDRTLGLGFVKQGTRILCVSAIGSVWEHRMSEEFQTISFVH